MNDSNDEIVVMENGSNNSGDMSSDLSGTDSNSDNTEQEEQEEQIEESSIDYSDILSDIHSELVDIHADVVILNDSINNVALCVSQFANVVVELFVILVFMVLIKTVIDNLLHFFK